MTLVIDTVAFLMETIICILLIDLAQQYGNYIKITTI